MIGHKEPDFQFDFTLADELENLKKLRARRNIPEQTKDNLLIASWNLTNFGVQKRGEDHLELMADIISPFDIIAVQEIADDLGDFHKFLGLLGKKWDMVYSDTAGNKERLAYLYRTDRVRRTGLTAELAMRGYERRRITIQVSTDDPEDESFDGFNRNPYMVNFLAGKFECTIVNVHLYWSNMTWRRLETKALGRWAKSRVDKDYPPNKDIILIGDFNMPKARPGDKIFDELADVGLQIPKHGTQLVGSNLAGDYDYDELAFFPKKTKSNFADNMGVFDFDKQLFPALWDDSDRDTREKFYQYMRYYIADHRPIWAEFLRTEN